MVGTDPWQLMPSLAFPVYSLALLAHTASEIPNRESELFYNWRFTANQFVLATSPLRLTKSNFIFQLNTCRCSPNVTSSLTRMGLSFTVAPRPRQRSHSGSESCLRFETPPTWRARCSPRHWVPFSSPPTALRAMVEVLEPSQITELLVLVMYSRHDVSSIIACSFFAGETTRPQSCSIATALVLSTVNTSVTWQRVYMSQYLNYF
jgi:hypothetical protein